MSDQMAEAMRGQYAAAVRSGYVNRTGWTQEQWIEDADRLMNEPFGAITSLVNGHVMALLDFWREKLLMPDVDWEKVAAALERVIPIRQQGGMSGAMYRCEPGDVHDGFAVDFADWDHIAAAARWGLESQQRGEHGRQCCDPPCRVMQIQKMSRMELVDALIDTEEELEMSRDYIDTLEAPDA